MKMLETARSREQTGLPCSASVYLADVYSSETDKDFMAKLYKKDGQQFDAHIFVMIMIMMDKI